MKTERYEIDRAKVVEVMKNQSLGDLFHRAEQAHFDDDYEIKPKLSDVGVLADVKTGTWHHYLYHRVRAERAVLERVAAVLGVDMDAILTDSCAVRYLRAERARLSEWARNAVVKNVTVFL